jgi:hypothetical protein
LRPSKKLKALIKRRKHKKVQKKERCPIENGLMKLNLIKEIFSSGLTSKFMEIMIVKNANLSFAESLTLSSTKPITNKTIKEQININTDKCF